LQLLLESPHVCGAECLIWSIHQLSIVLHLKTKSAEDAVMQTLCRCH
jgi:hypothetical protein